MVNGKVGKQLGYHEFRRKLEQVMNDLPVQGEFDLRIEQFDIERLEWLAILLYFGRIASSTETKLDNLSNVSEQPNPFLKNGLGCSDTIAVSETKSAAAGNADADADNVEMDIAKALTNLETQINLRDYGRNRLKEDKGCSRGSEPFQCGSITVPKRSGRFLSEENKHTSKVWDTIGIWISLLGGDQVSFLIDVNGSRFCQVCSRDGTSDVREDGCRSDSDEASEAVQTIHGEVDIGNIGVVGV